MLLCISPSAPVHAEKEEVAVSSIDSLVYELLYDALSKNTYYNLPEIEEKNIYLCDPINPYYLESDAIISNPEIEYYLIKADEEYIACVTICYDEKDIISASFSTDIALALEYFNIGDNGVVLVANNGQLFLKTESGVTKWNPAVLTTNTTVSTLAASSDPISELIDSAECDFRGITVSHELQISTSHIVSPRSWRILDVPYVSQGGYDICWAAAAAALGQYYTGDTYSHYSAYDLACMMGIGNSSGTLDDARNLLSNIFKIETTPVYTEMTYSEIISKLNSNKPLLVGFYYDDNYYDDTPGIGHMVVLCGFDYSGSGSSIKYYIRDSNSSSMQTVIAHTSDSIALDYYEGIVLYWSESAYKT